MAGFRTVSEMLELKDEESQPSKGKWRVTVATGERSPENFSADVFLVLCGLNKESIPIKLQDFCIDTNDSGDETHRRDGGATYRAEKSKEKPFKPGAINQFKVTVINFRTFDRLSRC